MRASSAALPASEPCLDERGHDADVGGALLDALLDGAHAVSDFQTDVPEKGYEALDGRARCGLRRLRREQQHVDIRAGMKLAASVTADRYQRPAGAGCGAVRAPGLRERRVDERGAGVHQRLDRLLGEEAALELLVCLAQELAPGSRLARAPRPAARAAPRAAARARPQG